MAGGLQWLLNIALDKRGERIRELERRIVYDAVQAATKVSSFIPRSVRGVSSSRFVVLRPLMAGVKGWVGGGVGRVSGLGLAPVAGALKWTKWVVNPAK